MSGPVALADGVEYVADMDDPSGRGVAYNAAAGMATRLGPAEWEIVRRFDGAPLEAVRARLRQECGFEFHAGELEAFVRAAQHAGLLTDGSPRPLNRIPPHERRLALSYAPAALEWMARHTARVSDRVIFVAGILLIACASTVVIGAERTTMSARAISLWIDLPLFFAMVNLVGLAHELGHGLALHRNGRRARSLGIRIVHGWPSWYCDVSESYLLPAKRQRLRVLLAGPFAQAAFCGAIVLAGAAIGPPAVAVGRAAVLLGILSVANLVPAGRTDGYLVLAELGLVPSWRRRLGAYSRVTTALSFLLLVGVMSLPRVADAAAIVGRVGDAAGRPIPSASITLVAVDDPATVMTAAGRQDGSFRIDAPDDWPLSELRVSASGWTSAVADDFVLGSEDADVGAITLQIGQMLEGVVHDEAGQPIANAGITVQGVNARDVDLPGSATTDANGRYIILDAPSRVAGSTVTHTDFVSARAIGTRSTWVLTRGGTITGVVVDQQRRPVPAVRVSSADQSTSSDADGTYTLRGIQPGPAEVFATDRSGHTAVRGAVVVNRETVAVDLSLRTGAVARGVVRDLTTGRPVPRTRVHIRRGSTFALSQRDGVHAITDGAGAFHVTGLRAGQYVVEAKRTGFLRTVRTESLVVADRPPEIVISMMREGRIEGRVVDEAGLPLQRVRVTLVEAHPLRELARQLRASRRDPEFAMTDQDGRFVLRGVWPGRALHLEATREGMATARSEGMDLAPGDVRTGLTLTLHPGVDVTGVVTDRFDRPLGGVAVRYAQVPETGAMPIQTPFPSFPRTVATTDSDGRYTIAGLEPGRYTLGFILRGYSIGVIRSTAVIAGTLNELSVVKLSPAARVSGTVVDESRQPLSGVAVSLVDLTRGVRSVTSDAAGGFEIADLTEGDTVSLQFDLPDMATVNRTVRVPVSDLVVQLNPAAMLRGRVIDARTRRALTDFSIERFVRIPGRGTIHLGSPAGIEFHAADGTFELRRVPPGPCVLRARATGFQTTEVAVPTVPTQEDIVIAMMPGVALEGRVLVTESRQPIANASVTWRNGTSALSDESQALMSALGSGDDTVYTDTDGRFVLKDLAAGPVTLFVTHPEYASARRSVSVPARSPVELVLGGGGDISGMVLHTGDGAAAGATVSLSASGEQWSMFGPETTVTDAAGRFHFGHLRPGSYVVNARLATRASPSLTISVVEQSRRDDVVLRLRAGVTINGIVRGLPLEALGNVFLMAHGQGYYASTATDADGAFTLANVPAGVVGLEATTSFSQGVTAGKRIEIPENSGGILDVEIEFNGQSTIEGTITRAGRPVAGMTIGAVPMLPTVTTRGRTESESDGHYRLINLQNGRYLIVLTGPQGRYQRAVDVSGATRFDIELPAGALTGIVVDARSRTAIPGALVTATSGRERLAEDARRATTDSTGRYLLADLDAGSYQIRVTKTGYEQEARSASIAEGTEQVDVELQRRNGLPIRVFDATTGGALSQALVRISSRRGLAFSDVLILDSAGRGEIPSLPPDVYMVTVLVAGYASRTVPAQMPSTGIEVGLDIGQALNFRLPVDRAARVRLLDEAGMPHFAPGVDLNGWADIAGPLVVWPHVPIGSYRLQLSTGRTIPVAVTTAGPAIVDVK